MTSKIILRSNKNVQKQATALLINDLVPEPFSPYARKGGDDDDPSLSNTHAQETLVHTSDEVALSQVGVIGCIPQVTESNTGHSC